MGEIASTRKANLTDRFGRSFPYLRLSITDLCNFRCVYCLPNGYEKAQSHAQENPLSVSEIQNLVSAFAETGTWKVRLTGGEPSLRPDVLDIARVVAQTPGIKTVAFSTNGYRLKSLARPLATAGIKRINVSVDSLNSICFKEITGQDRLREILEGIDESLTAGFEQVKVNAVLMKQSNADQLAAFVDWIRHRPITVRFIELMETGKNQALFAREHLSGEWVIHWLNAQGWKARDRTPGDGPAREYIHPDYVGRFGVITPYSKDFCSNCNRLRVTAQGGLRLCLFANGDYSIRHLLQSPVQKTELVERIRELLNQKEISHYLPEGIYGNNQTFSRIGG